MNLSLEIEVAGAELSPFSVAGALSSVIEINNVPLEECSELILKKYLGNIYNTKDRVIQEVRIKNPDSSFDDQISIKIDYWEL